MSNIQKKNNKRFSVVLQSDAYQRLINDTLGDKDRARRFVSSISSAVAQNPELQKATPNSVIVGALQGEALNLAPSPQLGYYYLVPFKNNKTKTSEAQFQMGYKGYLQLAMRSGEYQKIIVEPVKEGELVGINPFKEEIELKHESDPIKRAKLKTIGYYGMFRLNNGFTKEIYWSKEEMEHHANTYSQAYRARRGYSFWEKNFDEMANKTLIRQLISKWGVMSLEMREAYQKDMAVLKEDGSYVYVDNTEEYGSEQEVIEQAEEVEEVDFETI